MTVRIEGTDFQRATNGPPRLGGRGSGIFLHNDPFDRPSGEFSGENSIATGGGRMSYLTLPVIPSDKSR